MLYTQHISNFLTTYLLHKLDFTFEICCTEKETTFFLEHVVPSQFKQRSGRGATNRLVCSGWAIQVERL